jgi:predicted SAM-dependent methyltransferase
MNATPPGIRRLLHVGCGPKNQAKTHPAFQDPGLWAETRLDIDPNAKPDIVASMTDMSMIAPAQFDAIFSSHNLEHLYPHDVPTALAEFRRVLKPAGFALIIVPDLQRVGELIAADKLEDPAYMSPSGPICPVDMLYGFRKSLAAGNLFMAHKMGFTRKTLSQHLLRAGFAAVRAQRDGFDLFALGYCSKPDTDAAPQTPIRLREVLPV